MRSETASRRSRRPWSHRVLLGCTVFVGLIALSSGSVQATDADGDGFDDTTAPVDCDDGDPAINPGATEVCDSVDNDCDTLIDDADDTVSGAPTWYADSDGDTYGDAADSVEACIAPAGNVRSEDRRVPKD